MGLLALTIMSHVPACCRAPSCLVCSSVPLLHRSAEPTLHSGPHKPPKLGEVCTTACPMLQKQPGRTSLGRTRDWGIDSSMGARQLGGSSCMSRKRASRSAQGVPGNCGGVLDDRGRPSHTAHPLPLLCDLDPTLTLSLSTLIYRAEGPVAEMLVTAQAHPHVWPEYPGGLCIEKYDGCQNTSPSATSSKLPGSLWQTMCRAGASAPLSQEASSLGPQGTHSFHHRLMEAP